MEAAKKGYHMACKEEKLAATREANGKTEASVTPDQQKKLHEKVDKCKQDTQKVRGRIPPTYLHKQVFCAVFCHTGQWMSDVSVQTHTHRIILSYLAGPGSPGSLLNGY